jgi:hypothetical protein
MWKFENKMTSGNIVTIITLIVSITIAYAKLDAQQTYQGEKIDTLEKIAAASDGRIRAVELAQASTASDLRNIQATLNEIKTSIDRLTERP